MASITPRKDRQGKQFIDKDGKLVWRLVISRGFDGTGKRLRECEEFHGSKREAKAYAAQWEGQQHAKVKAPLTFQEWAERYVKHIEKTLAPTTVSAYRRMLRDRILPELGHERLDKLQSRHIARLLHSLEEDTQHRTRRDQEGNPLPPASLSGHTQLKYYRLVSSILQEAVYNGHLSTNPVKAVRPPRMERYRAKFYDAEEVTALWQALATEPLMWRTIIATALLLGLRRGELVGLRWGDIDYAKNVIRVERAAYCIPGEPQAVKAPKTATSQRAILIPADLKPLLQAWQVAQNGTADDYVCAERIEKTGHLNWFHIDAPTKWFTRFIGRHGLPALNLHGLRHTNATIQINAGIPLRTVAESLGHAEVSTTSNIYSHPTQVARQRAADALSRALSPKVSPNGDTGVHTSVN